MNRFLIKYVFLLWIISFAYTSSAQNDDSLRFDKSIINKALKKIAINHLSKTQNNKPETFVFLFLDTECPICQKYTLKIREIDSVCQVNQMLLVGVFTEKGIKKEAIENFKNKYNLKLQIVVDKKLDLAKALKASTTPEVFLIDRVGERIVYRGLIDNWFYRLDRSRKEPTEHYLLNAIDSFLKKQEISTPKTSPIGCLIEYN